MSLIDRKYLLKVKFDVIIHKTKQSIRVHDIDDKLHDNSKYTEFDFYVVDTLSNQSSVIVHFRREIHLVNDLRIHALFDVDILEFEQVILDMSKRIITFLACNNLIVFMKLIFKSQRIVRAVRSVDKITISSHTCLVVSVKIRDQNLSADRNYNFEFKQNFQQLEFEDDFFNHIIDAHLVVVQIRNVINVSIILSKHAKIDMLRDFEKKDCYHVFSDDRHLTAISFRN